MTNPSEITIALQDLSVGYSQKRSVHLLGDQLNVQAKAGELIALIGPNGAGKSTLIRTVCGLHNALSGEVMINNKSIASIHKKELAKQVSVVSTELQRTSRLKVQDLILLGRYPYEHWFKRKSDEAESLAAKALRSVGMEHHKNSDVTKLSDGEYQRIMIARALVQDTRVIILDEPTAFLDLPNKYSIVKLLWHLCKEQGKTIIFSSHDLNIAMQFTDCLWLMHKHTLLSGTPEDLLLEGHIENLFSESDLFFDIESNQFKIEKSYKHNIHIEGDSKVKSATVMAVKRLGFENDCNKQADTVVLITGSSMQYVWTIKGNNQSCTSIYELQQYLMTFNRNH